MPFFSIIIPTYNRATLIGKTLASVLAQTDTDFEVLVIDDGSTDDTAAAVAAMNDSRLHYYFKTNGERGAARNYGTHRAQGAYITFHDSDDILYPQHLAEARKVIARWQQPEVFHLNYEICTPAGKTLFRFPERKGTMLNELLFEGNSLSCMGVFLRADVARNHLFSELRPLSGTEDWLLWLQLAARYPIRFSNTITAALISHHQRSVLQADESQLLQRTDLLVQELRADTSFQARYGHRLPKIEAHMLTYLALHLALQQQRGAALKRLWQAARKYWPEICKRRTLAIFKHILFS
jgi:glycosyltransferase involved in cell wall biosynthesis